MEAKTLLAINGLSVGYPDKVILKDMLLHIPAKSIVAVLGLNGKGKSTFIRTLAGLQPALQGNILFNERPLSSYTAIERAQLFSIVLPGRGDVVQGLLVHELFHTTRATFTNGFGKITDDDIQLINRICTSLHIEHLLHKRIYQLSDGEAQLVFIARALIQDTPIIFMDEPTSYLDVVNKAEIFNLIQSLPQQNKTVVFTSHELELAIQIADYCLLIGNEGKHVFGTTKTIIEQGCIPDFFNSKNVQFDRITGRISLKNA